MGPGAVPEKRDYAAARDAEGGKAKKLQAESSRLEAQRQEEILASLFIVLNSVC